MARVLCRMGEVICIIFFKSFLTRAYVIIGCHVLALDLVRSWSFEKPSIQPSQRQASPVTGKNSLPPSPTRNRMLDHSRRRRSSIIIDLDLSTLRSSASEGILLSGDDGVKTREEKEMLSSKPKEVGSGVIKEEKDSDERVARKAGLGSLMKSAKQDVQVPEFDINAFF